MYRAFGLLRRDTNFTLEEAKARLSAKLPGFAITREGNLLTVSKDDWWIALAITSGPDIQMETEGIMGHLAGIEPAEAEQYVATDRRVEVWTDVSDPFMEHFGDYLSIVEVLKSFDGLLAVDPKEPGIL